MKPAAASSAKPAALIESGFASVVTSAPSARPNASHTAPSIAARSLVGRSVGVPPPKKTVLAGRRGRPAASSVRAANSTSAIAWPAKSARDVPRTSSAV